MKIRKLIVFVAVFFFVFILSWSKSTDFSQDLGRHLKLGEIIIETGKIPQTNLFSYTNPDFPFLNHHWLSEVIFYLCTSFFGLGSLYMLRFFLVAGAVFFSLKAAAKKSQYIVAAGSALLFLPLLLERIDIRPELFGYLFFAVLFYVMYCQHNRKFYFILPFIMALWVNIHISFVFGLLFILIDAVRSYGDKKKVGVLILSVCALLLNPHGLFGMIEPFLIFRNYGYSIVENQNLFFLNSIILNPVLRYYLILSPIVICSLCILLLGRKYALSALCAIFFIAVFWQIRHIPFFTLIAIPLTSHAVQRLISGLREYMTFPKFLHLPYYLFLAGGFFVYSLIIVTGVYHQTYDNRKAFGYEFYENQKEATDFILKNNLSTNIFNNFDLGGYAIYRLYPRYKVFVDNRPEAYPATFFQNVYIPLQEDDNIRKKIFKQYDIHTVLFSTADMTPWGRAFVGHMLDDPAWKLVFVNTEAFVMTDIASFSDVRSHPNYLRDMIAQNNDSSSLLLLVNFLARAKLNILLSETISKAERLNNLSCSIKRLKYESMFEASAFVVGVPSKPWWCY